MVKGPTYRPGQIVPNSGQYGVVNRVGTYLGREATLVRGKVFPPVAHLRGEFGWRLRDLTVHRYR